MTNPLDNVTPVNQQKTPENDTTNDTTNEPAVDPKEGNQPLEDTAPVNQPPPSNKERAEAKAAKEAKEAEEAEKAKAEAEAAKKDPENAELDTEVWGDMEDDVANSVLQTLQNSGAVTPDEAKALLWDAVEAGDPSKIDRDALVEKVGKAKATLIMAGVENYTSKNKAKMEEVQNIANEAAGSEQNWQKAVAWAKEKLTDAELGELRGMLDKGGRQAKFAANEVVSRYNDAPENTSLTAGKGQITPDSKSTAKVEGITRRQYGEELQKLQRKGATQAEFNALRAKREAGKKQGI